jgi:alpha-L-rhamnosidase
LTVNGRVGPLGIGGQPPSFGWRLTSGSRGTRQSAYEIRVGRASGSAEVWTSGKVSSDRQVGVVYAGPALQAATRYLWSVRAWSSKG